MTTEIEKDEHHTMNELYEHRHALFGALAKLYGGWKSKQHSDGTMFDGWFIAGIELPTGAISYHMPIELFEDFPVIELASAPEWDGYTPDDVVKRLRAFWHHI